MTAGYNFFFKTLIFFTKKNRILLYSRKQYYYSARDTRRIVNTVSVSKRETQYYIPTRFTLYSPYTSRVKYNYEISPTNNAPRVTTSG